MEAFLVIGEEIHNEKVKIKTSHLRIKLTPVVSCFLLVVALMCMLGTALPGVAIRYLGFSVV
jgi:hypothetical protein